MADAPVLGGKKRKVGLDAAAFGAAFNGPLVHESVRAELNARRRGTAATKTRGLVSGGGAKPWRQKGTGRARAGSSRSPVWTGGGTVFGPSPRSYTFKVNRKERRAALRSALSLHAERGTLAVLDVSAFEEPSTKSAAALLADWGTPHSTLVVLAPQERGPALSFRNIERVSVLEATSTGVADIVGAHSLLVSEAALAALSARATGAAAPEAPAEAPAPPKKAPAKQKQAEEEPVAEAQAAAPAEEEPAAEQPAAEAEAPAEEPAAETEEESS
jgi:large subunit ribosomal protein L4